jgi:hypothetical protein
MRWLNVRVYDCVNMTGGLMGPYKPQNHMAPRDYGGWDGLRGEELCVRVHCFSNPGGCQNMVHLELVLQGNATGARTR